MGVRLPVERLRNMGLKRSFVVLAALCLLAALALTAAVYIACGWIASDYPRGGIEIGPDGTITELAQPSVEQTRVLCLLNGIQMVSMAVLPVGGLCLAGILFYRIKLKRPISVLQMGMERIQAHDLDFTIPEVSRDELGQVCAAFETMRAELLRTNQELWRQAEERKRLNAAFAHDLRNPVTVLKGSVKLLRQDPSDPQALDRLERYTARIEQYVEAMSSVQRLEQLPVRASAVDYATLVSELEETARLLAPALAVTVTGPDAGAARLDHGLFLTVAENLIGNGARFAQSRLEVALVPVDGTLSLWVADDGPGFPAWLLESGPKPFGKAAGGDGHFGMGLYTSGLLCRKHGGGLRLENRETGGVVTASFQLDVQP